MHEEAQAAARKNPAGSKKERAGGNSALANPVMGIVQVPPVFLNLKESIQRAIEAIYKAADKGANVISFAECWAPGYPVWLDFAPKAAMWDNPGAKALFRLLADNSVQRGDEHLSALQDAIDATGTYLVFGTHEREGHTLYNTTFIFSPGDDQPVSHRKLVPTYTERLVWGRGDGSTMDVVDTPYGVLGSLICWEHWMPLARAAMHARKEAMHVAQWPAVNEVHLIAARHYAFEGRCIVAAAGSILTKGDIMDGFKSLKVNERDAQALLESMGGEDKSLVHNGGSAVINADASYALEPQYGVKDILVAPGDLARNQEMAMTLDSDGHYTRPDIFELTVNTRPQTGVKFVD